MKTIECTYDGKQYDDIEQLMADASKLLAHPDTRHEGRDLMKLCALKIARERNRMDYAKLTSQAPNIPPLEPAPLRKQLTQTKEKT